MPKTATTTASSHTSKSFTSGRPARNASPIKSPSDGAYEALSPGALAIMKRKKNADAQAAFRARRATYISSLEQTVIRLESHIRQLTDSENRALQSASELRTENARLRSALDGQQRAGRHPQNTWRLPTEAMNSKDYVLYPHHSGGASTQHYPTPTPSLVDVHSSFLSPLHATSSSSFPSTPAHETPSHDMFPNTGYPLLSTTSYEPSARSGSPLSESKLQPDNDRIFTTSLAPQTMSMTPMQEIPRMQLGSLGQPSSDARRTPPPSFPSPPPTSYGTSYPPSPFSGEGTSTYYVAQSVDAKNGSSFTSERGAGGSSGAPGSGMQAFSNSFPTHRRTYSAPEVYPQFQYGKADGSCQLTTSPPTIPLSSARAQNESSAAAVAAADVESARAGRPRTHAFELTPVGSSFRAPSPTLLPQSMSGTLASIRSQAFGKKTRMSQGRADSAAVSREVDALVAQGLGMETGKTQEDSG